MVSHGTVFIVNSNMTERNGGVKDSPAHSSLSQTAKRKGQMNSDSGAIGSTNRYMNKSSTYIGRIHFMGDLEISETATMMIIGMARNLGLIGTPLVDMDSRDTHGKDTITVKAARRIADTSTSISETPGTVPHLLSTRSIQSSKTGVMYSLEEKTARRVWCGESP